MASEDLESLRRKIDGLDEQLVRLLNDRAKVVVEIGKLKQQSNTPVYAPDREKAVLDRIRAINAGPLPARAMEAIWRELMSGSFALEKQLRIGFLGPEGSFSHAASVAKFGSSVQYAPLTDIPAVFDQVIRGHIDLGLVPVENSIHGGVVDTLDAFLTTPAKICAEVLITIHHNLLAKEPWDQVRRIYSKPEVFSQCRNWLAAMAKERDIQPAASTSAAAELAEKETASAAIGSAIAAERYNLHVLFENIEDNPNNTTRFVVIGRQEVARSGRDKTAFVMSTRNRPGAIHELLAPLAEHGVSMTRLESRPSRTGMWEYVFFVDVEGHEQDPPVAAALEGLRARAAFLKILGSFPAAGLA